MALCGTGILNVYVTLTSLEGFIHVLPMVFSVYAQPFEKFVLGTCAGNKAKGLRFQEFRVCHCPGCLLHPPNQGSLLAKVID